MSYNYLAITASFVSSFFSFSVAFANNNNVEVSRYELLNQSSINKNAILLGIESSNYITYGNDEEFDQNPYGISLVYDKVSTGKLVTFSMSAKYYHAPEQNLLSYTRIDEVVINNSQKILGGTHYLGRKKYLWSLVDEDWHLGAWLPLYRGNFIRPESQGTTGIISEFQTPKMRTTLFFSPLFVPNIGPSFLVEDGEFHSASPWFSIPAQQLMVGGNSFSIYYDIERPDTRDILYNPGGGGQVLFGNQNFGGWFLASYAYKPVNQLGVAIAQRGLDTSSPDPTLYGIKILPYVQYHELGTLETGYRRDKSHFHLGLVYDKPTKSEIPDGFSSVAMNDNIILSPSVSYLVTGSSRIRLSYLKRWEGKEDIKGDENLAIKSRSMDRYFFSEALKAEYVGKWTDSLKINLTGTYDAYWHGAIVSSEIAYRPQKDIEFVVGIEALGDVGKPVVQEPNFFSAYKGNDRVYGGVSYVF